MFNKVFISYATEDISQARELSLYLKENRFDPWLDKEKLKVGDNWDLKIKQALKNSDFVILLLSSTSIKKRGYFQREFKLALKYLEERLIDDTYILPVLLNECDVPEQLTSIQWIKYDQPNFNTEIVEALERQRKLYLETTSIDIVELKSSFTTEKLELIPEIARYVESSIEYPFFAKNIYWDNSIVNETIKAKVNEIRNSLLNFYFEDPSYFEYKGIEYRDFTLSYSIVSVSENYLSILLTEDQYLGGAHPNTYFHTLNFIFNPTYLIDAKSHFRQEDIQKIVKLKSFGDNLNIGESDECEDLSDYIEDYNYNLEFTINENEIEIIIANNLPRVIMVCGFFKTKYKIENHKIIIDIPEK